MKRNRKKYYAAGVAAVLCLATGMTSYAGTWEKNDTGWWYQLDDGTWPASTWFHDLADGNWYYFDQDGYMLSDTTTPDGYRVDLSGAWDQVEKAVSDAAETATEAAATVSAAAKAEMTKYKEEILNISDQISKISTSVDRTTLKGSKEAYEKLVPLYDELAGLKAPAGFEAQQEIIKKGSEASKESYRLSIEILQKIHDNPTDFASIQDYITECQNKIKELEETKNQLYNAFNAIILAE